MSTPKKIAPKSESNTFLVYSAKNMARTGGMTDKNVGSIVVP